MPQLSACYFCGTALDDLVQAYPIVPESRRSDDADPTTVTLCSSCHEKLDAIVGEVGDALQAGAAAGTPSAADAADDLLVDPDSASGSTADASPEADRDVTAVPDPSQADADETGPGDEVDGASDPLGADPAPTTDTMGNDAAGGPDDVAGGPDDVAGGTDDADGGTDDADAAGAAEGADADADDDDAMDADDATDADGDGAERSVVEGKHDISALEYNKVMRLLQNREFPVDREEIEVVAANAYQVARSDCATVIDVAVDRGLIAEEDGQLVKPEDA